MAFRFIHAADLHIDSPLSGLERYEGAPVDKIRGATREAMKSLVRLAIDTHAKFVLLCGDIYDGDWKDFNTGLFFSSQLSELDRHGIRVFVIHGNHDAASQITRRVRLPANTYVFSADRPDKYPLPDLGAVIHGQSFDQPDVRRDLGAEYLPPVAGMLNIGMLHTAAEGREGHQPYAPCKLPDLRSKGYDYWALGHVHKSEILSREPWIVFPGNTQGRDAGEIGRKGCRVVTVDDGHVISSDHADLDVVRWERLEVDVEGVATIEHVCDRARAAMESALSGAAGRLLAARVVISGATQVHGALLRDYETWSNQVRADAIGLGNVWVEKLLVRTTLPKQAAEHGDEAIESLVAPLDAVAEDSAARAEIAAIVKELRSKVSKTGLLEPGGPLGEEAVKQAIAEAVALVRARLSEGT